MQDKVKNLGFLGYPMYEINTKGHVFSNYSGKYLKPNLCSEYSQVTLYNAVGCKTFLVHRLVAEAFIPNPNGYDTVDHIDYNKRNNEVSNLRWLPKIDNSQRSWIDKNHDEQKKSVIQINQNGQQINEFESIQDAANYIGCDRSTISRACSLGRLYQGYNWCFKNTE